jgi:retron-type reverse transcriptase
METYSNVFDRLVATENLFEAWFSFRRGKSSRHDVMEFARNAERLIFGLQRRLRAGSYQHGPYKTFLVRDPKVRTIRKATVTDRIVHQAVYTELTRLYDSTLHAHVYSGRAGKGVHAGVSAVERMTWKVSKNYTRPCFYLKCDVQRFYDSVDHATLLNILRRRITDERIIDLLERVISSFHVDGTSGKGLPIGNVTSQIFTNIYLHDFDMYASRLMGGGNYARFADDFVVISDDSSRLAFFREAAQLFLQRRLQLTLHPQKVVCGPLHHGLDFLGYVLLPHHRRVRRRTTRRIFRKLAGTMIGCYRGEVSHQHFEGARSSYLGVLSHANTCKMAQILKSQFFLPPVLSDPPKP